jgi:purine operon repressor
LNEFKAEVVGVGVMLEQPAENRLVDEYVSLAKVTEIDVKKRKVQVEVGNVFDDRKER